MPQNRNELVVAGAGKVMVAPVGTVAPADPVAAWPAGWIDLGYTNDDGVTFTDARTIEEINVWQLFYPARLVVTARDARLGFALAQWNEETVRLAFGGGTITTTAGPPEHYRYDPPAPESLDERAMGIEWVDGVKQYRLIVPRGVIADDVETNLTRSGMAELPVTFRAIGEAAVNPWYLRTNDTSWAA